MLQNYPPSPTPLPLLTPKTNMQVASPESEDGTNGGYAGAWVPLNLQLGLPLQPDPLCQAVCKYPPPSSQTLLKGLLQISVYDRPAPSYPSLAALKQSLIDNVFGGEIVPTIVVGSRQCLNLRTCIKVA